MGGGAGAGAGTDLAVPPDAAALIASLQEQLVATQAALQQSKAETAAAVKEAEKVRDAVVAVVMYPTCDAYHRFCRVPSSPAQGGCAVCGNRTG